MSATFERFDYRVRPAKSVERRMMCDTFRNLSPFAAVNSYRYIGFGANSFVDFILFHRRLGIDSMVSIEAREDLRERIEFNCPYKCITTMFGPSSKHLPRLDWSLRSIVWLDYDKSLSQSMLDDVALVAARATSGTFLCVSIAADLGADDDNDEGLSTGTEPERRLELLNRRVPGRVPRGVSGKDLKGWGVAEVYRQIVRNEITLALQKRNGVLPARSQFEYHQILNFNYADGTKMLTCGGIIVDRGQLANLNQCDFSALDFFRPDSDPYPIEVPPLTQREVRHLEAQLPTTDGSSLLVPGVSPKDVAKYSRIYRYWHPFAAIES